MCAKPRAAITMIARSPPPPASREPRVMSVYGGRSAGRPVGSLYARAVRLRQCRGRVAAWQPPPLPPPRAALGTNSNQFGVSAREEKSSLARSLAADADAPWSISPRACVTVAPFPSIGRICENLRTDYREAKKSRFLRYCRARRAAATRLKAERKSPKRVPLCSWQLRYSPKAFPAAARAFAFRRARGA